MSVIRKKEYPRPQFVREEWQNLNGEWEFEFDDENRGLTEKWYASGRKFSRMIQVPYVYQSKLSGIYSNEPHDIVWYRKSVEISSADERSDIILHFGAVDYEAQVYVNGHLAGSHVGGFTPFSINITPCPKEGSQEIVLRVFDPHTQEFIPRGKQFWKETPRGIWYTNSTGIWQTVWMEKVPKRHIEKVKFVTRYDEGKVDIRCTLGGNDSDSLLKYRVMLGGTEFAKGSIYCQETETEITVDVIRAHIFNTNFHDDGISWTPEHPTLFDVEFVLEDGQGNEWDRVTSYFGFRKIHAENGMIYLNNKPYYQKLILDQGYWLEGLLTAPDDEALVKDIRLAKEMGFNGCRKHQKVEDARFLYWADKLGYLVWGESPSAIMYNENSARRILAEWGEIVERDYNHPSIVVWVPINESWGVPDIARERKQQHFSQTLYHYLHAVDGSRLVVSNDGWEMTETDICAIHNYRHGGQDKPEIYEEYKNTLISRENLISFPSAGRKIYAGEFHYKGEPIMLTEFGGIAYDADRSAGWGYTCVDSEKAFIEAYRQVVDAVYASKGLWGYCYTQLTDVEQEINGLLTYDRKPKCPLEEIRRINDGYHVSCI